MELILLQNIDNLGYKHDIVTVKPGYGRNYLIPQGYAVLANSKNRAKLDKLIEEEQAKENARISDYQEIADTLNGQTLQIGVKTGTSGKIFGKVTGLQLVNAIKEKYDIEIERRKIELLEEPKEIGTFPVKINLHPEVVADIIIDLVKE